MPDDQNDDAAEQQTAGQPPAVESSERQASISGDHALRGVQIGSGNFQVNYFTATEPPAEDPRQVFLAQVRSLALKDAGRSSLLSLVFLAAGATIMLGGGVIALMRNGTSADSTAALTSLAGVLIGTSGGALALHSKRAQRRLAVEADRVAGELSGDHTREEALALIDRIGDPALKDRLMSVTAIKVLGLAPAPDDVARRVFTAADKEQPAIEPLIPEGE